MKGGVLSVVLFEGVLLCPKLMSALFVFINIKVVPTPPRGLGGWRAEKGKVEEHIDN